MKGWTHNHWREEACEWRPVWPSRFNIEGKVELVHKEDVNVIPCLSEDGRSEEAKVLPPEQKKEGQCREED